MAIYLVQHGKSLPEDVDPEKGLALEGKEETVRVASTVRDNGVHVSIIKHSGKKRARQIAEIIASILAPKPRVEETQGLNPLDDVKILAKTLTKEQDLMLVGHLPFMQRLLSYLVTGSDDRPVFKFQNSGILCLDMDDKGRWLIKWAIMPVID